ncbi:hypothetical protein OIU78_029595 [Salix suchowensis]|nr:hypothetical protein OIU78_029595 [Salix suchowensis]
MLHLVQKTYLAKKQEKQDNQSEFKKPDDKVAGEMSPRNDASTGLKVCIGFFQSVKEAHRKETSLPEQPPTNRPNPDHHKRNQDALGCG